eukprot:scaffold1883_cov261-Pinguiococcus_pyrenoidosus.AAC.17
MVSPSARTARVSATATARRFSQGSSSRSEPNFGRSKMRSAKLSSGTLSRCSICSMASSERGFTTASVLSGLPFASVSGSGCIFASSTFAAKPRT